MMARVAALAAAVVLVAVAQPAAAHAWLERSLPPANARVFDAPTAVFLRFTENVEREYTGATVEDRNGTRVDAGRVIFYPNGARNEIVVPLRSLPDGVHLVRWQTLSVDTHTASGAFLFALGNASLEGVGGAGTTIHEHGSPTDPAFWLESSARGAHYLGLAAGIGVPLFLLVVVRPRRPGARGSRGLTRTLDVAAILPLLGAAGGVVLLFLFGQRLELGVADTAATRTGRLLLARAGVAALAGLVLAAGALAWRRAHPLWWVPLALGAAAGLAGAALTSLSSHAASVADGARTAILADLVHVTGAAVWAGGVLAFLLCAPGRPPRELAQAIHRFGRLAMPAVAAILVSGAYAALLHVPTWSDLWTTGYGLIVALKIAGLGLVIALGGFNQFWLGRRLRGGRTRPTPFVRALVAEVAVAVLVLGAAGALATTAPPGQAGAEEADAVVFEKNLKTSHLQFELTPQPPMVGIQNFTATLHPLDGRPVPEGTAIFVKFQPPGAREPDEVIAMERVTAISWHLRGAYLVEPGTWTVHVIIQRPDEFARLAFPLEVQ